MRVGGGGGGTVEPLNKDTSRTSLLIERLSSFRGDFLLSPYT